MQQLLIGRLWGIADSERDVLVNHDAADAVSAAAGTGATAVICNPPSFESVIQIAAQGERVPRKSTSFGPKPRTGLVLRRSAQPRPDHCYGASGLVHGVGGVRFSGAGQARPAEPVLPA